MGVSWARRCVEEASPAPPASDIAEGVGAGRRCRPAPHKEDQRFTKKTSALRRDEPLTKQSAWLAAAVRLR